MKTVAIVGSSNTTREAAPWDNQSIDIWVFNEAAQGEWAKRVSGVFQLHLPAIYQSAHNINNKDHWGWLQQPHDFPIWMEQRDPLVPSSVKYPLDDICREFLHNLSVQEARVKYFTSTAAYAIALALYKGYRRIVFYGIELASNTEYYTQQPGFTFWVGVAVGLGVKVDFYCGSGIFDKPLYGYDGDITRDPAQLQKRCDELQAELTAIQSKAQPLNIDDFEGFGAWANECQYIAQLEGRLSEAQRYQGIAATMLAQHGTAMIDRSNFEIVAGKMTELVKTHGELSTRSMGWLDYAYSAYTQSGRVKKAKDQLVNVVMQHIEQRKLYGRALGMYDENIAMLKEYDELFKAAGGQRAIATLGASQ